MQEPEHFSLDIKPLHTMFLLQIAVRTGRRWLAVLRFLSVTRAKYDLSPSA